MDTRKAFHESDLTRRFALVLMLGAIEAVDYEQTPPAAKIKIDDDLSTDWLPIPMDIGKNFRRWRPLRVGSQVAIGAPSGNLGAAVILAIYNTEAITAPSVDGSLDLIEFDDGTRILKNASDLSITTPCTVLVKSDQSITLDTPKTTITGTLHIDGHMTFGAGLSGSGDVVADGISLKNHKTSGVTAGSDNSGGPVA
jgi:phage baseplate assembly protein V